MGSRKRREVWHIDNLTEECGWFDSKTTVNNGYGCRHPDQKDVEKEHQEPGEPPPHPPTCGRCFTFTCPIASSLDPSDPDDAEVFRENGCDPANHSEGEWLQVPIDGNGRLLGRREEVAGG